MDPPPLLFTTAQASYFRRMPPRQSVWLITGSSSSLGRRLCLSVLARGDLVIAVTPSQQGLDRLRSAGAYILQMDSDMRFSQMKNKIRDALSFYGRIDIVVNNPDYDSPLATSGSYGPMDTYNTNTFSYTAIQITKSVTQECAVRQIVMIAIETPQTVYSSDMGDNVEGTAQLFASEYRARRIRVLLAKPQCIYSASGTLIPTNDTRAIAERIVDKTREGGFSELGLQVM